MAFEIEWLVPNKVIYTKLTETTDLTEVLEINQAILNLAEKSTTVPVYVLIDAHKLNKVDVKLSELTKLVHVHSTKLFALTVIVTDNRFIKFVTVVFSKITGGEFTTVETLDAAMNLLQDHVADVQLPPVHK